MRVFIVLLVLCLTSLSSSLSAEQPAAQPGPTAQVACIEAKTGISELIKNGYFAKATFEQDGHPSMLFSNQIGDWVVIAIINKHACIIAGGGHFRLVKGVDI